MEESLELRGLIIPFYKKNKAKKYCVYHQPINNNIIVLRLN